MNLFNLFIILRDKSQVFSELKILKTEEEYLVKSSHSPKLKSMQANIDEYFKYNETKKKTTIKTNERKKLGKEESYKDMFDNFVIKYGKLLLNDKDVKSSLQNKMFGDIAMTVVLYNSLIRLYLGKSFYQIQKLSISKASKKVKEDNKQFDQELLDYDSLILMIKDNAHESDQIAYNNLIRNILKIMFKFEKKYKVCNINKI